MRKKRFELNKQTHAFRAGSVQTQAGVKNKIIPKLSLKRQKSGKHWERTEYIYGQGGTPGNKQSQGKTQNHTDHCCIYVSLFAQTN